MVKKLGDQKEFLKLMQTKQEQEKQKSQKPKNSLKTKAKDFEPTNLINKQIELSQMSEWSEQPHPGKTHAQK